MDAAVLIVPNRSRLELVCQRVVDAQLADVEVVVPIADVAQTLSSYARRPRLVLAVLTDTAAEATMALASGADEAAMITDVLDVAQLISVVDRARARGQGRVLRDTLRDTVVHAEKLRALGTVVAGVAHEVNNPLAAMLLSLEHLRSNVEPILKGAKRVLALASMRRSLSAQEVEDMARFFATGTPEGENEQIFDELTSCADTIADVVRDLAVFSRVQESERRELVHIPRLIDQVLRIVGRDLRQLARVEREFIGDELLVAAPRARLVQIFCNLIINATQAIRDAGRGAHFLRISCRADEASLVVSFADTGVGIQAEDVDRIFDTFYTTKGEGTGLGLSISRAIARSLGGELLAESVHGEGANFICIFPKATAEDLAVLKPNPHAKRSAAPQHKRTSLMLVDPDSRVLRSLPRALRDDYDIITAGDGQEAIDLLQSGSQPSAILSEIDLPDVSGPAFWQWMSTHRPDLCSKTLFFSSPAVARAHPDFVAVLPHAVLEKPFPRELLTLALSRLRE